MRPLHTECCAEAMGIPADGSDVSTEFNLGLRPRSEALLTPRLWTGSTKEVRALTLLDTGGWLP